LIVETIVVISHDRRRFGIRAPQHLIEERFSMLPPKSQLIVSLLSYALLLSVLVLLPDVFYVPTAAMRMPAVIWFIHLITLYIHEAGHAIFRPFGDTMYYLGGSIMQVLVPLVWMITAWHERSKLVPAAIFFTGYSMVDISVYMKDAALRVLPLIGGSKTHHDWWTVLYRRDALDWGEPLGETFFWIGMLSACGGLAWGVYISIQTYRGRM
jgi:hypothetical protein